MKTKTTDRETVVLLPCASPSHEAAKPVACKTGPAGAGLRGGVDAIERHFLHRGMGAEFSMEVSWILRHVPSDARRIADVGCGNGALLDSIGPDRVFGVDPSFGGLEHTAKRHPGVQLVCADGTRLPLSDGSVDVITLQHVIEHIANTEEALVEWYRVLRPGGRLIILTPNGEFVDPSVFTDETHVNIFDRCGLETAVRASGFDIIETCTLGLPWFRDYQRLPSGWRFRRFVTGRAQTLASIPPWRWKGQTLCCAARKPESS